MLETGTYTRLAATLFTAALLLATTYSPNAGRETLVRAAALAQVGDKTPRAEAACPIGETPLTSPFADLEGVLSVSPLGSVTAPGEPLPAPYIRVNTTLGETILDRRQITALAPAKIDVTALERRTQRDSYGRATAQSWTVHFRVCESIALYYDGIEKLDPTLLAKAGGLETFEEFASADHIARETQIRLQSGAPIGATRGFDVGLHDLAAAPEGLERPERYAANPYAQAAAFDAPSSLIKAITPQTPFARCPIDYLPQRMRASWSDKLGDSWGIRRAKGEGACRTALLDAPGAAQGVWFTDAAHNAATTKVSAIALASDSIDPERLIFALHGRLSSLTPDLVSAAPAMDHVKEKAAKDFLSFERGTGRVNAPFGDVQDGSIYCYERLRSNFVGPMINGVILLQRNSIVDGPARLRIEAREDALSCIDLKEPWAFAGDETTFYR